MRSCLCLLVFLCALTNTLRAERPTLVVVLSIDQFCGEYLNRMRPGFQAEGLFSKLCDEGANYTNCHHGHAVTKTGPGHSVLMTGTFPNRTGIVDNDWFLRAATDPLKKTIYCVDDAAVQIIGGAPGKVGKSPKNLLVSTVGDTLKVAIPAARVFGLGLKDRAAILMAGHTADGAYWLDGGKWVTSTYYRNDVPSYLRVLNEGGSVTSYADKTWELLHPADRYTLYYPDDLEFEGMLPGSGRKFPHTMPAESDKGYFTAVTTSPFGNDLTLTAACQLIAGENLGRRGVPDILCVNLSSNDYVGHMFGPQSLEVQDITFRTDLQLGQFAKFIDLHLNGAPWVLFVTADHGVAPIPEVAARMGLPAARLDKKILAQLAARVESALCEALGTPQAGSYVQHIEEEALYLNRDLPELRGDRYSLAQKVACEQIQREQHIAAAYTRDQLAPQTATAGLARQFQRTFNSQRSGDVLFAWAPYHLIGGITGTTHGSPWMYDSHVPLLVYGRGVPAGRHGREVTPAAIAPTIASLLGVPFPPACAVEALHEVVAEGAGKATK